MTSKHKKIIINGGAGAAPTYTDNEKPDFRKENAHLSDSDYFIKMRDEIRGLQKSYGKDSVGFTKFIKDAYDLVVEAKYSEEKSTIVIQYSIEEINNTYSRRRNSVLK